MQSSSFLTLYVAPLLFSAAYGIFFGRLKDPEEGRQIFKQSFIPIWNWLIIFFVLLDSIGPISKLVLNGLDKIVKWIIPDFGDKTPKKDYDPTHW